MYSWRIYMPVIGHQHARTKTRGYVDDVKDSSYIQNHILQWADTYDTTHDETAHEVHRDEYRYNWCEAASVISILTPVAYASPCPTGPENRLKARDAMGAGDRREIGQRCYKGALVLRIPRAAGTQHVQTFRRPRSSRPSAVLCRVPMR